MEQSERIPARVTMVRPSTTDPTKETIRIYSDQGGVQDLRVEPGRFHKHQDVTVEFDGLRYSDPQPATVTERM